MILLLIITHFVVGAFGFMAGSQAMKTKMYKELMKYFDDKSKEFGAKK